MAANIGVGMDLLERTDALSALDAALSAVSAERAGRVVFVGGEAGVGKTTLLRRFAAEREGACARAVGRVGCSLHAAAAGAPA